MRSQQQPKMLIRSQNQILSQYMISHMPLPEITVTDVARNLSDFFSRIHYQGTGALVVKGGKPLVKVTSARRLKTCRELAVLWPTLPQVPTEEAVRFERDLKAAKNNFSPMKSKWD
jgi:hypothetical protein